MDLDAQLALLGSGQLLSESQTTHLMKQIREVLYHEATVLTLPLPITICGDVHGQLYDVYHLFQVSGGVENNRYLFLGDYVDRGYYSLQTFSYLVALKLRYPDQVFLLRGNHECRQTSQLYGFYDECVHMHGHAGAWRLCNEVFDLLPIGAVVANRIFCVHGGLSPAIRLCEQICLFERQDELPTSGGLADLVWSDPDEGIVWQINQRGAGWLFGSRPTNEFMQNNKLDLIARAHQLAMQGYTWHQGGERLVTVWSAPNYMYRSGNEASVLKISEDGTRQFVLFTAVPDDQRVIPDERTPHYFA